MKKIECIDFRYDAGFRTKVDKDVCTTITTKASGYSGMPLLKISRGGLSKMRIRRLTPKECCRLMGFEDKDYEAMKKVGLSDSAIYHCCGDSIVSTVLMMIFSKLTNNDEGAYRKQITDYVERVKNGI